MDKSICPNRAPCDIRAIFLASQIRWTELLQALKVRDEHALKVGSLPIVVSAVRDVISISHDRDVRTYNLVLRPSLVSLANAHLCIIEIINDNQEVMAHIYKTQAKGRNRFT